MPGISTNSIKALETMYSPFMYVRTCIFQHLVSLVFCYLDFTLGQNGDNYSNCMLIYKEKCIYSPEVISFSPHTAVSLNELSSVTFLTGQSAFA